MSFNCDQCGLCCKSLHDSEMYKDLNRGDGVCKHYDEVTNLCSIYDKRPLKCRIDDMYEKKFKQLLTLEQYYELNYEGCKTLKMKEKI